VTASPFDLAGEQVEHFADLVANRVVERMRGKSGGDLIDAAEVARRFSLSRDYVYRHADDLGAVRLGDGPKARLRFSPAKVDEALGGSSERESQPKRESVRPVRRGHGVTLLPIRKESP
jgi:hypothetical protein